MLYNNNSSCTPYTLRNLCITNIYDYIDDNGRDITKVKNLYSEYNELVSKYFDVQDRECITYNYRNIRSIIK